MSSPSPLQHAGKRVLEFNDFRQLLAAYTASPLGREQVLELEPSQDREWIEAQQQLTEELRGYLRTGGSFDFHGLLDPSLLIDKSRIRGAVLELSEIRDILLLADRASEWREIALHPTVQVQENWQEVASLSQQLADFTPLLRYFGNKILPDGTLDDRASPALARIRREIEKQKRSIQESLRSYLRRLSEGGAVQDELVTIRGDRFVIPVKTEQRRRVQGVAHGASSSGQTVFMEPMETIEQNNELVRLLEDEQSEIHRILLEMTGHVGEYADSLAGAVDILSELELQFAKARFAQDYDCVAVRFLSGGAKPNETQATEEAQDSLVLRKARHPLLERTLKPKGRTVVPCHGRGRWTAPAGRDQRTEYRRQDRGAEDHWPAGADGAVGRPIPAERGEMPILDGVFADIGDSNRLSRTCRPFRRTSPTSIAFRRKRPSIRWSARRAGSATDPEEGAALAVAIADYFRRRGCLSIVSTHHTALKVYAANTPGVLNAAVGFDEQTLAPTYELLIGVPGASAGINIAQRIGLNPEIVAEAREKLTSQAQDVGRFLDRLHSDLREIDNERLQLRQREQELARERNHLAEEGKKEQREKIRELEKKLESVLRDFEYRARETVNAVQDRARR